MKKKYASLCYVILSLLVGINAKASNYYWVGNGGNWSDFANHWATTSGGNTFASAAPTSADNVFFDANSFSCCITQTVTINAAATCNNINWTGVTYTPTFTDPGNGLSIYGSLTFVSGMTVNLNGAVNFLATTTGQTITTANKTITGSITFNGTGGGWTLQDSLKAGASTTITLTAGTLSTNDKVVSCEIFYSTGALTRVLNMGASVFNLGYNVFSGYSWDVSGTGLTINAGTSVINGPANATTTIVFYGGGQTYNNVNFLSSASAGYNVTLNDNSTYNNVTFNGNGKITGANTFSDLTFSPGFAYTLPGGLIQTITGSLTGNGTCTSRIIIQSSSTSAAAIISKASGTVTLSDATLTWMFATGGATFTANNSIDGGNNTGWTINAVAVRNLYWIGNGGNWNDPNHWSLTSGGAPYGCYPSSAGIPDNVFFDANSFSCCVPQTVTINVAAICNNMNWTGVTNNPTFTDPGNGLNVYGSLTLASGMILNLNGTVNFLATTTGQTITTANKTFNGSITFSGTGGAWTLQDSLKAGASANITLTAGTLNTNDKTVSCVIFYSTGALTRVLNMGASIFNLGYNAFSGYTWDVSGTSLTINAGTSVINGPANATTAIVFYGGGHTYNNVNFLSSATAAYSATINDNSTYNNVTFNGNGKITGTNTFSNLTFSPGYTYTLTSGQIQTITNNLTANGTCTGRIYIQSSTTTAAAIISKASGSVTLNDVTLTWMFATGGATFTANNSIDGGNNTGWNITNPVSHSLYWIGNSGNWNDGNHWSLTSGGAPYGCYPSSAGVQDNVFFDANSFDSTGKTVTINVAAICNNMNWTGVTNTPTFTDPGNGLSVYGSLTLVSGMTVNLNGAVNFLATTTGQTVTTANKTITGSITFNGAGGGWTLQDSLKSGANITLTSGTLNTNSEEVSCVIFYSTGALTRVLNMGASVFNLGYNVFSGYSWDVSGTGLTINAGTSVINGPANATTAILFYGGGQTYNNVNFLASATAGYSATINDNSIYNNVTFNGNGKITGTNTFNNLTFSPGYAYTLTSGQTQTIGGSFSASGTCTAGITIGSSTTAVSTISKASSSVTLSYVTLSWNTATGGATFTANNSVNAGNNTGWVIGGVTPVNLYWIGNSGNWNDPNHWSLTSGGAAYGCTPRDSDNVFFDANSFDSTGKTVTINVAALCHNMNWTGVTNTPTFTDPGNGLSVFGSLTLAFGMTVNLNGAVNFLATAMGQTITTGNKTINGSITFNGAGGGWTLQDSLKSGANITLTSGTLNTNGEAVSCVIFYSTGALTRVLNMGASVFNLGYNVFSGYSWDVSGTGLTINAGTSVINGPANATTAILFYGGGQTYNNVNFLSSATAAYSATINDNSTYNNVTFNGNGKITGTNTFSNLTFSPGYTYTLTSGQTQTIANSFNANGTCTGRIYIQSSSAAAASTISKASGTVTVDYATITWMTATGGATFNAGNSIDGGNNTGWNFTAPVSRNLYWIGNSGNWNDGTHWSLTSGGAPLGCYPSSSGIKDNVFFDANSFSLPTQTVTLNVAAICNNMTWTGALYTPVITDPGNGLNVYGSLTLISGMTVNLNGAVNFLATTTGQTITTANKTITGSITFNGTGGGWTLQDSLKAGASATITLTSGTLNTNGEVVSCQIFYSTGALTRVLNMGASVFNLGYNVFSGYSWDVSGTGLTINAGTSVINGPANATTTIIFYGGSQTYNNVNFLASASAGYNVTLNDNSTYNNVTFYGNGKITGTNTFDTLTFSPGFTYILTSGQTQTVNSGFIANGTCTGRIYMQSSTTTGVSVIRKLTGTVTVDYVTMTWMGATGGATFNANNSIDGGNNTGWNFTAPVAHNLYWIGNSGNWSDGTHWSLTSGGAPLGCYPNSSGAQDNVFFDANSFSLPTQTVTINVAAACNNMSWTGALYTPAFTDPGNGLSVYGSLTLIPGMTLSLNGAVNFLATTTGQTITTANKTINGSISFSGTGGGWTLQDSLKAGASATITLTSGTLNTNGEVVNCEIFYSTGALTRVLNMGASVFNLGYNAFSGYCWDVSGTGLTINAGTSVINGPANATTGIVFYGGGHTYNNVNFLASATVGYSATINDNSTYNNVTFYGTGKITGTNTFDTLTFNPGFTYILTNGQTQTINGTIIANGTCAKQISIKSSLTTAVSVIGKVSGAITINYCTLTWMGATGGATFTANNSVDGGNNEGWIINAVPGAPTISINGNILQSSSATGNQWYLNGNIINGATGQFYTASVSGVYTVVDTSGGCTYTSAPYSFIYTGVPETGITESLLVYPNPASTEITVQSGLMRATNGVTVSVINVLGEIIPVHPSQIEGDKATVNITNLPGGIYFLVLKTENGTAMKRFVKQ